MTVDSAGIGNLIRQHPPVLDSTVCAVLDEEFGQMVGSEAEVADTCMDVDRELRAFLATRLSHKGIPSQRLAGSAL